MKFIGRTSSSRSHTGVRSHIIFEFFIDLPSAVRALIFLARRIQPFLSLVDREVESCVIIINDILARPLENPWLQSARSIPSIPKRKSWLAESQKK